MATRWRRDQAMGVLLGLAMLYGAMSLLVYRVIHMRHITPLGPDAPPGQFSEGRVLHHLRRIAVDIPARQEGTPGLEAAAQYIKAQLLELAAHAGPEYRIEVEETLVSGSFSMMFLRHRVTLGYRNHKNIVMRISSNVSEEDEPSLLVNGHFDSPFGSPGAADCGSCVASMLELSRLILESRWVPPRPVIFLFNGAEELFLLGSHGFIKTHKWNNTIGAFINIEASGSGGADLVCQSGPGSWPSRIYAQSAKYPMANSVAQIYYPSGVSLILHSLPATVFLLTPMVMNFPNITMMSIFQTVLELGRGMLLHAFGLILAIIIPAMVACLRLLLTKNAMNWFAHPYLAYFMFVPAALVGILLPRFIWELSEKSHFWGAFGLYSLMTLASMLAGLSGGFLTFSISMSLLLARFISSISMKPLRSLLGYVLSMIPCLLYCVYFGGFLIQFLIEKMGMMGSLPKPFGYFMPDIIVGSMVGVVVGWCFGPLAPIASRWLAKTSILLGFLQITVIAMAISSQQFPYSTGAPKRVLLQHSFVTDSNNIVESNYGFSVVDANSLEFVFDNAPAAAKWLKDNSVLSYKEKYWSDRSSWVALYPIPFLFSGSLKFPARTEEIRKHYEHFPVLVVLKTLRNNWNRRVHLVLSLGSLSEIWATSLNITGPLSNWSFADNTLPAPQIVSGGPPSYICRLTGQSNGSWSFWLEASSSEPLRIDVAVLDQFLVDSTKELKSLFPSWADMTVFTTFFSSYHL